MFTLREATPEDLDTIAAFLQPFVDQRALLPRDLDELERLLRHAFIAEAIHVEVGIVMGFAALEIYSRKLAEIQCLAVHPEFQGKGIGQQLVGMCVGRARRENVLELMAISSSDAFLKRCGFDYSLPDQKRALFARPMEDNPFGE